MFNATTEQQDILATVISGKSVVINAFAGAGKTSTLEYVSKNLGKKRILYMAFNKVAADEAAARMPSNVECRTVHSLAYQSICKGTSFAKRIQGYYDYREIGSLIKSFTTPKHEGEFIDKVISVLKAYCNSAFTTIGEVSVEFDTFTEAEFEVVCKAATIIWEAMTDTASKVKITHDIYLKLYQLSKPSLAFDILMLDEAQDSNPVTLDIVNNQNIQRILVGDKYQAIYAWRGSVNAMDSFPNMERKYLTESFRFGQDIADKANILLAKMGSPVTMKGVGGSKDDGSVANLVRSNSNLYREMLRNAEQGNSIYVEADLKDLWSALYTLHAMRFAFYNGTDVEWPKYPNKQFQSFSNWETIVKVESPDVARIVKLVEKGYGTHKEISTIKCNLVDDKVKADVCILTGHKSKGSEFSRVMVAGDFTPTNYTEEGYTEEGMVKFINEQGCNLLYVAMTRPTQELVLDDNVERFLNDVQESL